MAHHGQQRSGGGRRGHHGPGSGSPARRLKRHFRRWLRRRKWVAFAGALALLIVVAWGLWMAGNARSQRHYQLLSRHPVDVGSGYRDIVYQGRSYRYNNRVTAVLCVGVDSQGALGATAQYTTAPRADSIALAVLDELNRKTTIIALNRDTMTGIHRYTLNGRDRGVFTDHLGYAFTYGDGGAASCENLCRAVSDLLGGIPINDYVVVNLSSLPVLSEAVGPVEVTVPNDDLADLGYAAGQTVTIDGANVEQFVRTRDIAEDFSNAGRMERQRAYVNGAMGQFRALLDRNPSELWRRVEQAEGGVLTSITRSRYLDMARALLNTTYEDSDYWIPGGEQVAAEDYDEFYPDGDALRAKVIEVFYMER